MDKAREETGKLLRELREKLGWKVEEFAAIIDCNENEIRKMEEGTAFPSGKTVDNMVEAYLDEGLDSWSADLLQVLCTLFRRDNKEKTRSLRDKERAEKLFQSRDLVLRFYDELRYGKEETALGHLDEIRLSLENGPLDYVYQAGRLAYGLIHVRENENGSFPTGRIRGTGLYYSSDYDGSGTMVLRDRPVSPAVRNQRYGVSDAGLNMEAYLSRQRTVTQKMNEKRYMQRILDLLTERWPDFDGEHLPEGASDDDTGKQMLHSDIILFSILSQFLFYNASCNLEQHQSGFVMAKELYDFLKCRRHRSRREFLDAKAACLNLACMAFHKGKHGEAEELLKECRKMRMPDYNADTALHFYEKRLELHLTGQREQWSEEKKVQKFRDAFYSMPEERRPTIKFRDFLNEPPEIWLF